MEGVKVSTDNYYFHVFLLYIAHPYNRKASVIITRMSKTGERAYFKAIGKDGLAFTLAKPFSDPVNTGAYLTDIGAVFAQLPQPPARILDLGCGSGWTSNFYAQAGFEVIGVDISKDAVKAANETFVKPSLQLSYRHADYDKLGYADEFDAVVFFDSLHHSDDERDGLRAAYKALKPGGSIILCEPGTGHSKSPSSIEAVAKYGVNERDMPPKLSRKALRAVGFVNTKVYTYPAMLYRANYKIFTGKRFFINNSLTRGVLSLLLATLLKRRHGIVTARK